MNDRETTVEAMRQRVEQFVACRDWHPFHTPKNLAMSLAIEAAELMEHFQWLTPEQSRAAAGDPERITGIADELADVLCYALALANALDLDLSSAFERKMAKNEAKYPADKYRGVFGPDDPNAR